MKIKNLLLIVLVLFVNKFISAQCVTQLSYCTPTVNNVNNFGIGLQNVTFGSSINNSTTATGLAPNYFDFTNLSVSGQAGGTINLSVQNGNSNNTGARVFIDWDQNGTYGTSSPELVWTSGTTTPNAVVTGSFNIPSGQSPGVYRIRVTGDLGGQGANPCNLGYGEIEDYTLIVTSSTFDAQSLTNTNPTKYVLGNNTVAFRYANLSTTTITSMKIGYQLGSNAPVIQYLTGLNIAGGSTSVATFSNALNISSAGVYNIKIWLDSLNGGATTVSSNDTICRTFNVCNGLSGTYTIDPAGSGGTNFTNINAAIQALVDCGVSSAVVFNIATGTYNQQVDFPSGIDGVSAINSITFQSATGNAANVVYSFNSTNSAANYTFRLNGGSFLKFRNLTLTASGSSFGTALLVNNNSHNDSFFNVVFNGNTTTSSSTNLAVIFSPSNAAYHWLTFQNCIINNGAYGIYMQSSSSSSLGASSQNFTVQSCQFNNPYAGGIYLQYFDGLRLIDNKIITNSTFTNYYGVYSYWIMILDDNKRPQILRNEIIANSASGQGYFMAYYGVNSGTLSAARKPWIFNNMISIGANNTNSTYGLRVQNDYGSDFLHNTVNIRSTNTTNTSAAAFFESISSGTSSILNNIFTGNNGSPAIRINTVTSWNPCNFNNLHSTGTNLAFLNTTAHTTIASWRTASGRDANSVNTNPSYVSTNDLRITGANLLTVALDSRVSLDIDNQTRCGFTDIGADFHPVANDIGISATVHPNGNVAGSGARDIVVVLTNYGSNTVTSANVHYTDGTIRTVNWTGSLAPCQSTTVTFTGSNQYTFSGAWNLTFYTSLPNGVADAVSSNDGITRSGCVGLYGNYTINPSGSGATNFTSFQAAINAMTTCGIATPIVFTVSAATYNEQISIPAINGASAINTITFDGVNPSSRILQFSSTTAANPHVMRFNNCSFITFRNLTIRTDNTTNGWPVHFLNGTDNSVVACVVEINGSGATATASNLIPVVISGSTTSYSTTSTLANNHRIDSNTINAGYFGTTVYMNNAANIINIRNNTYSNPYQYGIYAINPVQLRVLNNNMIMRTATTGTYAIFAQSLNLPSGFFEISGNKIQTGQYGIYLSSCNNSGADFNMIYNNMIGGTFTSTSPYGIYMTSVTRTRVLHNSINVNNATTGTSAALYIINGSLNQVVNNHLVVSNPSAANVFNLYVNPVGAASLVDYNNYFTNSSLADVFVGSSVPFNLAYPNGGGINSVKQNPKFVSSTDLHSTAFCILKGQNQGLTRDIDDETRNNPPTIGADEPFNSATNDIGIAEVISPAFPLVIGTQPVKVVLRNFGSNTITSATLNYKVNGGTAVSQSWTGSLNTCDTVQVTFNTQHNFGTGASFVEAYTTNPNGNTDNNRNNDSIKFSICPAMAGTYTINPSGSGATNFTSFNNAISALVCAGISGPVQFNVSPATYNEQISIPDIQGNSTTNTIVFDGISRTNRIVSFATTSVNPYVLRFFASNNVTFRNLTLRSTSTAAAWGVHYFNGTNNRVSNCDVLVNNSIASTAFNPVVVNSSPTTISTQSALSNNNMIDSSNLDGGYYGIQVAMTNVNNTFTAKDNNITQSYLYGYYSNGNYQPRVLGNTITLRTAVLTTVGVYIINCNNTQGNNMIINGNRIINPGQYGFYFSSCSKSGTDYSQLTNNMAGNFRNTSSVVAGIFMNSVSRMQVFHNSIDLSIATLPTTNNAALFIQNGSGNEVKNNHLVVSNPNAANAYPVWITPVSAVSALNSNNYLNNSSPYLLNLALNLVSKNGYKQAYPIGGGVNSINVNPFFVSATDQHSTNTCDNGEDLSAFVPQDLDYETRSTTPDIGADEVLLLANNDLGVYKINHPTVPVTNGSNTINVTIKNYGSNTVTSATIGYILNNGTAVTQSWSGSLATCDTANVVFSSSASFSGATDLKAFTSMPNGSADPVASNDTSYLKACAPMSGTYTIGTTGDFSNFTSAVNALYCGGVNGPVTFNVQSNNYFEQVVINDLINGISPSNSVTFQSSTGNANDVVLVFSGATNSNFTLNLLNAQYLKFKNMTIKAIGVSFNTALLINNNSSNDSFFNVVFEGLTTTSNTTNQALIFSPSGISNNIYFGGCTINNGSYGSYFNSNGNSTSSENLTFENCVFNNQYAYGMFNQGLNGLRLIGNSVVTNSTLTSYFGIYNNNIAIVQDINRPLIIRNKIWGAVSGTALFNQGFGIASTMNADRRPLIANNMIQIGSNSSACIGIRDNNSIAQSLYLHNSVHIGGTSTSNTSAAGYFESSSSGNILLNNSFSGYANNPAIRINNIGSYRSNYNNLFTTGTNLAYNNFTALTNLVNWRANSQRDSNSVSAMPMYSSNFDLHANQVAMNNAGLPLSIIDRDIDGDIRCPNGGCFGSTSNPDIGADEFLPIALDAAINSINSPSTAICPGAATVQVTLRNVGSTTLTSATIHYSLNGVTQTPFNWTGSLVQNAVATVNIGTPTFTAPNTIVKSWVSSPNGGTDLNSTNDSALRTTIFQLRGVMTIGGSNPDFKSFNEAAIALNTRGICGPVTFNVRQGVYGDRIQLNSITGSSAINFITFRPDPANTQPVELIASNNVATADNHTIFLNGTRFVQFREMRITNTSPGNLSFGSVIRYAGANDSILFIKNIITGPTTTNTGTNFAVFNHGTGSGNVANRCVVDSNEIYNGSYGFYIYGNTNSSAATFEFNNRIRHNKIINSYFYGVYSFFQRRHDIIGNEIRLSANTSTGSSGLYMQYVDSFRVERNAINVFGQYGIFMGFMNNQFGTGAFKSTINNNMIGGRHTNPSAYGIYFQASTPGFRHINIFHNSVSVNSSNTGAAFFLQQTSSTQFDFLDIRNNSFANFGSGTYACYFYNSPAIPSLTIDYNNYFTPGTNYFVIGTTGYGTANGGSPNWNNSSYFGNPGYFSNLWNLHAARQQLSNKGVYIPSCLVDIDNQARPLSPSTIVDIGADEYNILQNDIGITALANNDNCTNVQSLRVNVTNFAPKRTDSLRIQWSVNSVLQPTVYTNSNITFGNTSTFVVQSSFNFTDFTNYRFAFWTQRPNGVLDSLPDNDTFRTNFYFLGNAAAPTVFPNAQCGTGLSSLQAKGANPNDSISWYSQATGGTPIGYGNIITGPVIAGTRNFFAQGIRFGANQTLTPIATTAVNVTQTVPYGGMLSVTVNKRVKLDSLLMRMWYNVPNTGYQLYYKTGTFTGFQTNSAAWTLLSQGAATTFVQGGLNYARVPVVTDLILEPATTYSFYFTTQVNINYPTGNCVGSMSGGPTVSNSEMTIIGGGSIIIGQFGANQVLNNWHPQMGMVYKTLCENGPRTPVQITVKPKPVSSFAKGAPFQGIMNTGIFVLPDVAEVNKTNTYDIVPPVGYTNAGHNNTWAITGLTVTTSFNNTIPDTEYDTLHPTSSANGKFIFKPSSTYLDSMINFKVRLSDFGPNFCDTMIERHVMVAPTPFVNFDFDDTICLGSTTFFTNLSTIHSGDMIYRWYFDSPNNDTSDLENPEFVFPLTSVYNVRLVAISQPWGVVKDTIIQVVVTDVPNIKFKVINNCEGQAVVFQNQTTVIGNGSIGYRWDFGDNSATSTLVNPTKIYAQPRAYRVTLTANYNGCKISLSKNAYQFPKPVANFIQPPATCLNKEMDFINTSTIPFGNMGANWNFGDGNNYTIFDAKHAYPNSGTYDVKLIAVSEFNCLDSITKTVTVKQGPVPNFTTDQFCSRIPSSFTNTTVETVPNPVYTWNISDGFNTNSRNFSHNWANEGEYTVTLKVDFTNGCSETISKDIKVLSQPKAQFDVKDICSGETARFVNKTVGDVAGIKYNWNLGNGTDNVASPIRVYNNTSTSTYSIKLVASYDDGCSDSMVKLLTVSEAPSCDFTFKNNGFLNYSYTPSTPGYAQYEWFFGDGGYQAITDPSGSTTYKYNFPKTFNVKMVATNAAGCQCEITKTVSVSTDIKTIQAQNDISIYPNPNNGLFNIKNSGNLPMAIDVYNAVGVKILSQNVDQQIATINLDHAASGVYLVKVTINGYESIYKITITE